MRATFVGVGDLKLSQSACEDASDHHPQHSLGVQLSKPNVIEQVYQGYLGHLPALGRAVAE